VTVIARSNKAEADAVVKEIEAKGGKALTQLADIANAKAVQVAADTTVKQFGRIDCLINNAAIRREKNIGEMSYDDWREVMAVTLDGAFHCVKACLPALKQNGGTIVNVGGMSAHIGSKDRAHVMAAKLGLVGFTRGLAHDLAGDGITVNCVVPGAIETARTKGAQTPAHHLIHGTITGERGKPEDVAALARFLCGHGARHLTGQTLHVNNGAYLGS
jgi:3-oxoacyl-[acyl-carrier protein] reductase